MVVALGTGGQVGIYNSAGTINVAVDVEGYFAAASGSCPDPASSIPSPRCGSATPARAAAQRARGTRLGQGQWEKVVVSGCPTGSPSCTASVPTE